MLMNAVGALVLLGSYLLIGTTIFVSKLASPLWIIFLIAIFIGLFSWDTRKKHKTSLIISFITNIILGFSVLIGTILYCKSAGALWAIIPLLLTLVIHNEKID